MRLAALLVGSTLAACRAPAPAPTVPLGAPAEASGAARDGEPAADAPHQGVAVLARFRHPQVPSPFDAGRVVAVGRTDTGFVLGTIDDPGHPSSLRLHFAAHGATHAVAIGAAPGLVDPALAAFRAAGAQGGALAWVAPRTGGVELGSISADGTARLESIELVGAQATAAGWCGTAPLLCGVRDAETVVCSPLADPDPRQPARTLDWAGWAPVTRDGDDGRAGASASPGGEGSGLAPAPERGWSLVGLPHLVSGSDAAVLVWLGQRDGQTRPLARVLRCDGSPAGPRVDLAGEAWAPRTAAWAGGVLAVVVGDELAWMLPSGVEAMARAGSADLRTGQSARLQVEPLAAIRERPLLFVSRGAALFLQDAVGLEGERTMVRWRDGAPRRLEGLTPLGGGAEGRSARLAAAGAGVVALVVADGVGGADVVLLDADAFTRAP